MSDEDNYEVKVDHLDRLTDGTITPGREPNYGEVITDVGRSYLDEDTRTEIARENVRRARIGAIVEYTESDDARFQLLSEMALMAGLNARDAAWFASATLQAVRVEREACAQIADVLSEAGGLTGPEACVELALRIRERT